MDFSYSKWKKAAALSAATLLALSAFALTGCGGQGGEKAAFSQPAAASAQAPDSNLKPGVAVVHRAADVKYSVPEGVSVLMYHMIGNEPGNAAIMTEANLRIQMNYLRDHGYHPITMQDSMTMSPREHLFLKSLSASLSMTDISTATPSYIRS